MTHTELASLLEAASHQEIPTAELCLNIASVYAKNKEFNDAATWLLKVVDANDSYSAWQSAAARLEKIEPNVTLPTKRTARVAILGSYTTTQFIPLFRLAARRQGIALSIYECPYGQFQQEILDPKSELYSFNPDFVILAVHAGELSFPSFSETPEKIVDNETKKWSGLWNTLRNHSSARIIQHNFALPYESPMGHLSARQAGSRKAMIASLNVALGERAGTEVSILDCDRLSSLFGKSRWFDDRYWFHSKQGVSLAALPILARHQTAVLAAELGLTRKSLVLDLDNTLWGGIIGEDGLDGIALGPDSGAVGEAFAAFQDYILELKNKGVILAVCSKNNEADAKLPFEKHPGMRIKLDDISIFIANWQPKSENIRAIAESLNIGLESLVFVDDNPSEREQIRQLLPEVDVITLPADPMQYVRTLADYLMFECASFTPEDAVRTKQYKARAEAAALEASATSLEDFHRSLEMRAVIASFDEANLPRIAQLIGKTNQFNLTTRRHSSETIRSFMADPNCIHSYLKLADRFVDHGLISLAIAFRRDGVLDIDTWLMSCRVIGRTVENAMLARLSEEAARLNCQILRGTYIPTAKNALVKDVYKSFGFELTGRSNEETTVWQYDLNINGPITNEFIAVMSEAEAVVS